MNKSNLRKIIIEEIENTLKEQEDPSQAQTVLQACASIQKACEAIIAGMTGPGADEDGERLTRAVDGEPGTIVEDGIEIVKDIAMLLARLAVNRGSIRDTGPYERALRTLGRKLGSIATR
jgi:hypothetical protein